MQFPKHVAVVVALAVVPAVAACGGGKSDAEKAKEAAVQAKAACDVFVNFHPPAGSDANSQVDYATATYGAFLKAADLADKAVALDPRWRPLRSAAEREAAGFGLIVKAAKGTTELDSTAVNNAVRETKAARVLFISECAKADPKNFTAPPPSASPTVTPSGKRRH